MRINKNICVGCDNCIGVDCPKYNPISITVCDECGKQLNDYGYDLGAGLLCKECFVDFYIDDLIEPFRTVVNND